MSLEIGKIPQRFVDVRTLDKNVDDGVVVIYAAGPGEGWTPLSSSQYLTSIKSRQYGYISVGGTSELSDVVNWALEAHEISGKSYPVHLPSFAGISFPYAHELQLYNYPLAKQGALVVPEVHAMVVSARNLLDRFGTLCIADTTGELHPCVNDLMDELRLCGLYPKKIEIESSHYPFFDAVKNQGVELNKRVQWTGLTVRQVPNNVIRVNFKG